jgi:hypothetical protein
MPKQDKWTSIKEKELNTLKAKAERFDKIVGKMKWRFKLYGRDNKHVGYMELQPRHCDSCDLIWRYSKNGKTGWDGQLRHRPFFNRAELTFKE